MNFTSLDALVPFARARAQRGLYDGRVSAASQRLIDLCSHEWHLGLSLRVIMIFTRDVGHHSSGWWKNPDYERCFHLSLSYRDLMTGVGSGHRKDRSEEVARAFFGDDARRCWIEGPYSPEGKFRDVWHYRLFCDPAWMPISPKGEVYSRENTPADWRSFSEIHGLAPAEVDAPFLTATSEAGT
jgi:hypothetical protein